MRGLTTTIILVLVLAGLGAYIYFVESERPAGGIEDREKVFAVEADQIERDHLDGQGRDHDAHQDRWGLEDHGAGDGRCR